MFVVGPLAALGVCALVDVGPGGEARASLFPLAVSALDPFVWTTLRHSVTMAGLASLAAIIGGTIVGRLTGATGGPSRAAALVALGLAAASPPYLLALGASGWLESGGSATWARVASGSRWLPADAAWAVWTLAAMLPAAALGALAYLRALDDLAPSWREAAALAGGTRAGRWRRLAWPLIRPTMARVGALVFAVTLADPGPPLLLGLRRTLGFQMVLAATDDSPFPRLAALGLVAILAAAAWRAALRLWSGRDRQTAAPPPDLPRPTARRLRTLARVAIAAAFAAPVAAAMIGVAAGLRTIDSPQSRGTSVGRLLADPSLQRILVRSLILGLGVSVLALASDRVVARLEASAGPAAAGRFRRLAKLSAPPPLAAGVVVLALGRILTLAAAAGWAGPSPIAGWLAGERTPVVAATLAVWLAMASSRIGRRPLAAETDPARDARYDAAILAGARRGRARRLAAGTSISGGWPGFAATLATAAVAVAPALLILASAQSATVGPGVMIFRERPDAGAAVAALLGLIAWGVALATSPIGAMPRRIDSTPDSPRG